MQAIPMGYSYPIAINNRNQIVGQSLRADYSTVVSLWQKNQNNGAPPNTQPRYEPADLNALVGRYRDWFLVSARDISNTGLIVDQGMRYTRDGQGQIVGQQEKAYLLIPIDVKILSPVDHAVIPLCDDIVLRTQTSGLGSPNVTGVQYYVDNLKVAESLDPNGWPAIWQKPPSGQYTIVARAVFDTGPVYVESSARRITVLPVTRKAIQIVYDFEVGSGQGYYENVIKSRPEWPGDKSGITIGIGYDLQYNSADQIRADWGPYLPPDQVDRLSVLARLVGSSALRNSVADITIPWNIAEEVFYKRTVSRYVNDTLAIYPNADVLLSPNDFGALVSIIFNRGNSLTDAGRSTKFAADPSLELRQIRDALTSGDYESIPQLIRDMKRLWPDLPNLTSKKRTEHIGIGPRPV